MTYRSFLFVAFLGLIAFIISPKSDWYMLFAYGLLGIFLVLTFLYVRNKYFTTSDLINEFAAGLIVGGTILRIFSDSVYARFLLIILLGLSLPFGGTQTTLYGMFRRPLVLTLLVVLIFILAMALRFSYLSI